MFQELNISNAVIFLIDCHSYTFPLVNVIISDRILYIIISCHKCKKKFCNYKILVNFQMKSPHCNGRGSRNHVPSNYFHI